eukprot:1915560-Rhodomonas_salina.2
MERVLGREEGSERGRGRERERWWEGLGWAEEGGELTERPVTMRCRRRWREATRRKRRRTRRTRRRMMRRGGRGPVGRRGVGGCGGGSVAAGCEG